MVSLFPVPRTQLPQVHVSPEECAARRAQMQRMLASLVDEYEQYAGQVDARRWKARASRDRLKIYKERSSYAAQANATNGEGRREFDMGGGDGTTPFSEERADNLRMSLLVGECAGRIENAMLAVHAADQSELAMADIFLHEDVADCAILHTMEGPREADPYHFLGYKWFVRKSPTNAHIIKHRDSVYVECIGLTQTRAGEPIGYHIMHSVDLVDFPVMKARNCLRSSQSIRTIYRQRPGNVVEVFMVGNIGPAGMIKGRLAEVFAQDTLFNMTRLVECGEVKRLAIMADDLRPMREDRIQHNLHPGESCALCRLPRKRFSGTIEHCMVCGLDVCGKCRMTKRMFAFDGTLGRFNKIISCKTCVLVVANAKKHGRDVSESDEPEAPSSSARSRQVPLTANAIRSLNEQLASRAHNNGERNERAPEEPERILPASPAEEEEEDEDEEEEEEPLSPPPAPERSGPTTTYRNHVIDISGSLAFIHGQANIASHEPEPVAPAPASRFVTTYRGQVIDISGSLGVTTGAQPTVAPSFQPLHDEPPTTPPPVAAAAAATIEPPYRGSSMASAAASPPASSSPASQADLYAKMLELQRKAQDAYNTTRQNQQYIVGQTPVDSSALSP